MVDEPATERMRSGSRNRMVLQYVSEAEVLEPPDLREEIVPVSRTPAGVAR
jgi:hypothetical protein